MSESLDPSTIPCQYEAFVTMEAARLLEQGIAKALTAKSDFEIKDVTAMRAHFEICARCKWVQQRIRELDEEMEALG